MPTPPPVAANDDFPADERIDALLAIMARLRDPKLGCSWDLAQDFKTIAPYTISEAYEVSEAIHHGDTDDLKDELGDLLFQVVFHAQMASEQGLFGFGDVVRGICEKMLRRHPHVFTAAGRDLPPEAVAKQWDVIKAEEKRQKAERLAARGVRPDPSVLAKVPREMPALDEAHRLQDIAAKNNFDWNKIDDIFDKLDEEVAEVKEAIDGPSPDAIEAEIGDLLFVVVNLARRLNVDSATALRRTNAKFRKRFAAIEKGLDAEGKALGNASLDDMEKHWFAAKADE